MPRNLSIAALFREQQRALQALAALENSDAEVSAFLARKLRETEGKLAALARGDVDASIDPVVVSLQRIAKLGGLLNKENKPCH